MKEFRAGIIGFGFIGKVHAWSYLNAPLFYAGLPPVRITHVCTAHEETAKAGAAAVGAPHAVVDYRQVTENPDVDIVHICTPNHLHKDELLSAMRHNKHIYCDKPLTATMDEAREVEAALVSYAGIAQMTLQNRFFPSTMRAKQMIDDGFLGEVLEFRAAYLHGGSADPNAPMRWKLSGEAGGGVLADLGPHVLDIIHHLLGDFAAVSCTTRIAYPQRPASHDPAKMVPVDAEDCAMMLVKMRNGAIGTVEMTKIATGAEDELRFEIHGSKGALRFNGMDAHHLQAYDRTAPDGPVGGIRGWTHIDTGQRYPEPAVGFPGPKFSIGWMRSHMACLANFLRSLARGEPAHPDLRQGIYLQHLIECARKSDQTGGWVDVTRPS